MAVLCYRIYLIPMEIFSGESLVRFYIEIGDFVFKRDQWNRILLVRTDRTNVHFLIDSQFYGSSWANIMLIIDIRVSKHTLFIFYCNDFATPVNVWIHWIGKLKFSFLLLWIRKCFYYCFYIKKLFMKTSFLHLTF